MTFDDIKRAAAMYAQSMVAPPKQPKKCACGNQIANDAEKCSVCKVNETLAQRRQQTPAPAPVTDSKAPLTGDRLQEATKLLSELTGFLDSVGSERTKPDFVVSLKSQFFVYDMARNYAKYGDKVRIYESQYNWLRDIKAAIDKVRAA